MAKVKEVSATYKVTLKVGGDFISAEYGEVVELVPTDDREAVTEDLWARVVGKVYEIQETALAARESRK